MDKDENEIKGKMPLRPGRPIVHIGFHIGFKKGHSPHGCVNTPPVPLVTVGNTTSFPLCDEWLDRMAFLAGPAGPVA
jgi:hypothetical protein